MPAARRAKVEAGLRAFEGTVSWGGHWTSPIDEMHYELSPREGDSKFAAFANKLRNGHLGIYGEPRPVAPPVNLINVEADVAKAWIGKRLHAEERKCGADGKGRYADFEHGSIFWHPDLRSAIAVPNHVLESWNPHGGGLDKLGYPVLRHTVIKGVGDIQAFQKGTLYRKYGQAGFPVWGEIGRRWIREGYENGPLGWPISEEYNTTDGGKKQHFENGFLLWHPDGAVRVMESDG